MKRAAWLLAACLSGALMVLALVGGLQGTARAEGMVVDDVSGAELVQNPGFEDATGGQPDSWTEYGSVTFAQVSAPRHGGSYAAVLTNTINTTRWAYQVVQVAQGERYEFSGWANKNDVHIDAVYIQVRWYSSADGTGAAIDSDDSNHLTTDDGDYRYLTTGVVTAPVSAQSAQLQLRLDPDSTAGDVAAYFDDVSLQQIGAPDPKANLVVVKTGPVTAEAGSVITYHIAISNTGDATATGSLLTDTLPSAAEFVTQTSPFTFSEPGGALRWELGDLLTGTLHTLTVTARVTDSAAGPLTNYVSATTTASETVTSNNSDDWTTTVGEASILISAVLYDGYQDSDRDEAVQLVNVGNTDVDLTDWELCDAATGGACTVLPAVTVLPGERIWAANYATGFYTSSGFLPDLAVHPVAGVDALGGSWPGFANGSSAGQDEVVLRDADDSIVDAVVYEQGATTITGWSGAAVQPYALGRAEGQILYRIPDEATGLPAGDTNTAADWIQYPDSVLQGRRVLYPGWDLDPLFWPLTATETATVVVGIAPDNGFDVVSDTIARAQRTISIEVYSLRHPEVITALVQKAREGVSVTVLLEGQQALVGQDDDKWQQELWACRELEAAGGACWFMIHDTSRNVFNRYDYLHAKFIIVDDEWVLVTSQNLTESGFASDDKSNGTGGSRGVVLATDAPSVVARAAQVFDLDADAANHNDLLRWSAALTGTYGPPVITFTPRLSVTDYASVTVSFDAPLVASGAYSFELFTAPEAALRQSDALLGLVGRAGAGDAVYVEQMYEYVDWGDNPADDPNIRLEAYIAAARRGATVRILLNEGTFGGPAFGTPNTVTVAYVNRIARDEGLDLIAALGDPTHYGIHNKMVLVWLAGEGGYAHVGSINGSEGSSKVNREMAIQVGSTDVYAYLKAVFDQDWQWSQPVYVPLVLGQFKAPAGYLLISEVDYTGLCEWVEIYNPTRITVTLTGFKIGDAQNPNQYEGMYVFPAREMAPGEVILVAGDATQCNPAFVTVDYELFGAHPSVPNLAKDPNWGQPDWHFGLSSTGDEVLLLNPTNQVVDVVVYGAGSYPGVVPHPLLVDPGDTLERIPANVDTDDCSFDFEPGWSPNNVRLQ